MRPHHITLHKHTTPLQAYPLTLQSFRLARRTLCPLPRSDVVLSRLVSSLLFSSLLFSSRLVSSRLIASHLISSHQLVDSARAAGTKPHCHYHSIPQYTTRRYKHTSPYHLVSLCCMVVVFFCVVSHVMCSAAIVW